MKHISYEKWLAYVNDKVDENTRITYENHLYQCDTCLSVYMEAMNGVHFIEAEQTSTSIMSHINKQINMDTSTSDKTRIHKKTILHYTVAVAMTFILMTSGVFSQLTNIVHFIETDHTKSDSFVTELLNEPLSIVNQVKFKERE